MVKPQNLSTRSSALRLSEICKEWCAFKADYVNLDVFIIIIPILKKDKKSLASPKTALENFSYYI